MNGLFRVRPISLNWGLLVIRVGVGLSMLVFHGWDKITGGTETWEKIGANMEHLGLGFAPVFWGLMGALAESVGSVLLLLGFLFRPAALALAFTMIVASVAHLNFPPESPMAGWKGASHALELLVVYLGLFLTGPGRFSVDSAFKK